MERITEIRRALELQREALNRMQLEMIHYRQTGKGLQFLEQAWQEVQQSSQLLSPLSGIQEEK